MKDYTIKELLERKDRRDSRLHNSMNAVGIIYAVILIGFVIIAVKILT
jgi:hypothetical protein